MKKICIIQSHFSYWPKWKSMERLYQELECLVKELPFKSKTFYLYEGVLKEEDLREFLIYCKSCDDIIYYSNSNYKKLFSQIKNQISQHIRHIFPIFGDLLVRIDRWTEYSDFLKSKNVHFICASEATAEQLKKLFIAPSYSLIPYSIDDVWFEDVPISKSAIRPSFIYFGRLNKSKGVIDLIKLFSLPILQEYKITIIGCPNRFDDRLFGKYLNEDKMKSLLTNLPPNIEIVKWLDDEKELIEYVDRASCFISLSRFHDEDFGLATAEALARGKDLILTKWGGFRDFSSYGTYFVDLDRSEYPYSVNLKKILSVTLKYISSFREKNIKNCSPVPFSKRELVLELWENCIRRGNYGSYQTSSLFNRIFVNSQKFSRKVFDDKDHESLDLFQLIYFDY